MNYDNAYDQVKNFVRENSYDRYLIILMQPRKVRPLLMMVTAFHMEFQACCRYYQTPIVMSMRLRWWQDQLERIERGDDRDNDMGKSFGHSVLVCLVTHVQEGSITAKDIIACLEGFQSVFDAAHELCSFGGKIALIIEPYAYLWAKIVGCNKIRSPEEYEAIYQCVIYWAGYKLARGCNRDLEPYRYYFSDLASHDQKQDHLLEDKVIEVLKDEDFSNVPQVGFKASKKCFFAFSFRVMGDYYKSLLYRRKAVRYSSWLFVYYVLKLMLQRIFYTSN